MSSSFDSTAEVREGHHPKTIKIIVNGQKKEVATEEISYRHIVELAFESPWGNPNVVYTVTYSRGHHDRPQGSLVDGQSVNAKPGMVFNVTRTDKS